MADLCLIIGNCDKRPSGIAGDHVGGDGRTEGPDRPNATDGHQLKLIRKFSAVIRHGFFKIGLFLFGQTNVYHRRGNGRCGQ